MANILVSELCFAAQCGYLEEVKTLLATSTCENKTKALYLAITHGHQEIVIILIASGASPDGFSLYAAVYKGYTKLVSILLEAGADINFYDGYILTCAVENYHLEIVRILLAAGANFRSGKDFIKDGDMRLAVRNGRLDIVEAFTPYYTIAELEEIQSKLQSPLLAEAIARKPRGLRTKAALREP